MNEIIDVEYKEIESLGQKSTPELTTEVNTLWHQMEAIGNLGIMMAAEAGRRLNIIQDRLPHGTWEEWCNEHLTFSVRKARNMMRLAEKMEEENSLFSNRQTFADIGISKVWELLSAPEEVAKEVIETQNVEEISVRELKEEIKRLKEENASKSETQRQLEAELKELETAQEASNTSEEELAELKKQCETLKDKLAKEKEKVKAAKQAGAKAVEAELETAREEARAEAFKENETAAAEMQRKYNEALEKIEKLTKAASQNDNKELAVFKVKSDQLQEDFNSCLASIARIAGSDAEMSAKLKGALKQILAIMEGKL